MTLPTKLFHYSQHEVKKLNPIFYDKYREYWPEEGAMKPCGVWISVEDGEDSWFDWCKSEEFRLENLRHKYSVVIAPDAKILHLKTPQEIQLFSLEYAANDPLDFSRRSPLHYQHAYIYKISWKKIKEKYDGIIIAPYQHSLRFDEVSSWYYTWDCASGCIWNLDKVSIMLHSLIDVGSMAEPQRQEEESARDLLSAGPVLLESTAPPEHTA